MYSGSCKRRVSRTNCHKVIKTKSSNKLRLVDTIFAILFSTYDASRQKLFKKFFSSFATKLHHVKQQNKNLVIVKLEAFNKLYERSRKQKEIYSELAKITTLAFLVLIMCKQNNLVVSKECRTNDYSPEPVRNKIWDELCFIA